jgi:hypothetical protein
LSAVAERSVDTAFGGESGNESRRMPAAAERARLPGVQRLAEPIPFKGRQGWFELPDPFGLTGNQRMESFGPMPNPHYARITVILLIITTGVVVLTLRPTMGDVFRKSKDSPPQFQSNIILFRLIDAFEGAGILLAGVKDGPLVSGRKIGRQPPPVLAKPASIPAMLNKPKNRTESDAQNYPKRMFIIAMIAAITGVAGVIVNYAGLFKKPRPTQSQKVVTKGDKSPVQAAQSSGSGSHSLQNSGDHVMQAGRDINNTTHITNSQADLIEGTDISKNALSELFPFGYLVTGHDREWIEHPHPKGELHWRIAPENVDIKPDFSSGIIHLTLKNLTASNPRGFEVYGNEMRVPVTIQKNVVFHVGDVKISIEPGVYFVTLSDNERFPVFAIGFRHHGRPTKSPFILAQ